MKAFVVDRYGKNRRLRAAEVPSPVPGSGRAKGKVVVKVR
jgi:NADPH:quinone reductase-like Zn-dependent oxidoreductase